MKSAPISESVLLLPSGSEQNQVLRGSSIPIENFVIGELGVKAELKVVRDVGNGSIENWRNPPHTLRYTE